MCFAVSKAAEAAKAAESVKAAKAAEAAKAAKAATKQAAAAQKKAAAEEASHRREAERLARDAQLQEQQRAAARERAAKWEREREAVLAASKKLASRARARAAKAETDAKEEATRECWPSFGSRTHSLVVVAARLGGLISLLSHAFCLLLWVGHDFQTCTAALPVSLRLYVPRRSMRAYSTASQVTSGRSASTDVRLSGRLRRR